MTTEQNSIDKLEIPIRLSFPVLSVNTFEIGRAESVFSTIAGKVKKSFEVMPFKKLPDPNTMKSLVDTAKKNGKQGVVVFDPYFFDRQKTNPETLPALKSSLVYLENEGVNYIIAGKESLSEEFAYHIDLPPMSAQEIKDLIKTCESNLGSKKALFDAKERDILANYALGQSHTQMKNVFTYSSYLKYKGKEYLSEVRKEKAHILRDAGLDVLESINIDDVGGLANLKQFLKVRFVGLESRYRSYLKAIAISFYFGLSHNYALADTFSTDLLMSHGYYLNEICLVFLMASIVFSFHTAFTIYRWIRFRRGYLLTLMPLIFIILPMEVEKISNPIFSTVPIPGFWYGAAITSFIIMILSIFMNIQYLPIVNDSSDEEDSQRPPGPPQPLTEISNGTSSAEASGASNISTAQPSASDGHSERAPVPGKRKLSTGD